jgi:hypothetical protein
MLRRLTAARDFYAGLLLIVLGSVALQQGASYRLGTLTSMGPGFMPAVLGSILILLGVIIACGAATARHEATASTQDRIDWVGCLCIVGGPLLFLLMAERFGLAPASFACVFVAALGDRSTTWRSAAILAFGAAIFGVLLFNLLLGVPLPILQWGPAL